MSQSLVKNLYNAPSTLKNFIAATMPFQRLQSDAQA